MRTELAKIRRQRMRFSAVVASFGSKRGYRGREGPETILLREVRRIDTNEVVTDHLWFTDGIAWGGISEGYHVSFDARVEGYFKGYQGTRADIERTLGSDYKLTRPTKVVAVEWDDPRFADPNNNPYTLQKPCAIPA